MGYAVRDGESSEHLIGSPDIKEMHRAPSGAVASRQAWGALWVVTVGRVD